MRKEDIIKSEVKEFYDYGNWKKKQIFPTAQDLFDDLKLELINHQVDGQIIYLGELIRLIDLDAQKHLKTCPKKDKPNECQENQFYSKSKYYVEQILDSITVKNESPNTKYELNKNLSKETLFVIEDLMDGKRYTLTKDRPEEISEIINRLNNFGFLNKVRQNSYSMNYGKRKYLAKLIELQSWDNFKNWLNKDGNAIEIGITNNFYESSVGQINQANNNGFVTNPKYQKSSKKSKLKTWALWIGIIGTIILIIIGLFQII
ncbi:MAG: hypothetical protein WBA61_07280 [Aequorivita sp.]